MDRSERKKRFDDFYQKTYQASMVRVLTKTGDFLNAEDLLAEAYYSVYRLFMKDKKGEMKSPERCLAESLKKVLSAYGAKHRKEWSVECSEESRSLRELLSVELELDAEEISRRMLSEDILEFVSSRPLLLRRAFVLYLYFSCSLEEIAAELKCSVSEAEQYLCMILGQIKDEFLEPYEA